MFFSLFEELFINRPTRSFHEHNRVRSFQFHRSRPLFDFLIVPRFIRLSLYALSDHSVL